MGRNLAAARARSGTDNGNGLRSKFARAAGYIGLGTASAAVLIVGAGVLSGVIPVPPPESALKAVLGIGMASTIGVMVGFLGVLYSALKIKELGNPDAGRHYPPPLPAKYWP